MDTDAARVAAVRRRGGRRVIATLALTVALAAVAPTLAQRFEIDTYLETDGLPSSNVMALTQGPQGRMWFATRAGVASYDGSLWEEHGPLPQPNQNFSIVRWDDRARLWVASRRPPFLLRVLEDGEWKTIPTPSTWRDGVGIDALDATTRAGNPRVVIGNQAGDVLLWNGSDWREVRVGSGSPVRSVAVNRTEVFARVDDRIYRDTGDGSAPPLDLPQGAGAVRLAIDAATEVPWLVGTDWIARIDDGDVNVVGRGLSLPPPEEFAGAVALDPVGGLYVGYHYRVVRFEPDRAVQSMRVKNGLAADGATGLMRDREGNVWIASPRGVSKIASLRFAGYRAEHGLHQDEVTAVLEYRGGQFALGHIGALSFFDDTGIRTKVLASHDRRSRVLDLAGDGSGRIWAALESVGLAEISPEQDVRWHLTDDTNIRSVRVDHAGVVWVAANAGIYCGGSDGFEPFELSGLRGRAVRRILRDGDALYFATLHGLYRLEDGKTDFFAHPTDDAANSIYAVLRGVEGNEWVGTAAGLMRVAGHELVRADLDGPGTTHPVYFLTYDREQQLWIGTDNGVLRWDGEQSTRFSAESGLIGRETNRAAGLIDSRGRVWIGTDRGVSIYHPDLDYETNERPIVELLGTDGDGKSYAPNETVRLPHHNHTVVFKFRAVSLIDETRVRVQTRLAGFEDEWLEHDAPRSATIRYTHLPPGSYRLHVRAANAHGKWSETVVSTPIVVLRPFWQRPLFYVLLGLAIAALGYATHHYVTQRQYARRLESEVRRKVETIRQSEARVRRVQAIEKRRLEVTLGGIADGVIAADRRGTVMLVNPAAERITGWTATAGIGRRVTEVLPLRPATGDGRAPDLVATVLESGGTEQLGDLSLQTRDGGLRLIEFTGAAMRDHEDAPPSGVVLAFRDITEKRDLEGEMARTQRLEALGVLAGGIAHDFNNLLTIVLGNLSLLRGDDAVKADHERSLDSTEVAVQRARELTQQLLTFSRGGAPVRRPAAMDNVVRDAATLAMTGTNSRSRLDLPAGLWAARVDVSQINQVIHNLVINAVQAMPHGGTVTIACRNRHEAPAPLNSGRYVEIEVSDVGHGIEPEHLDRVFDPYFSTKEGGSGLGLAAAHSIVRRHDGLLTVDSTPGSGTVFRVYLPATRATADPLDTTPPDEFDTALAAHVLVMDDDAAVRDVVGELLQARGCTVEFAEDGAEAVVLYVKHKNAGHPFDLVLMDLTVPGGMGGKEAMEQLLAFDPAACAVVISGYSNDPVMGKYANYGFRACVHKPFGADELSQVLAQVLPQPRATG